MVKQYPHTITWKEGGSAPTRDENGFIIPNAGPTTKTAIGRYENYQKGGYKEYLNANGEVIEPKGIIYMKKGQQYPKTNETIEVTSPEHGVMFKGTIQHTYPGQLNTTLIV